MTMIYALFGIPLVLLSLNDLGKWIFKALLNLVNSMEGAKTWIRIQHRLRVSRANADKTPSVHSHDSKVEYELMKLSYAEQHALRRKRSENTALIEDPELGLGSKLHKTKSAPSGTIDRDTKEVFRANSRENVLPEVKEEEESEDENSEEIEDELRSVPKIPVWIALVRK